MREGAVEWKGGACGEEFRHADCVCGVEEVGWGGGVWRGGFGEFDALLGGVERTVFPDGFAGGFLADCFHEFVVFFVVVQLQGG